MIVAIHDRIRGWRLCFLGLGTVCALLALFAGSGCGARHDWVGNWQGDRPPLEGRGEDDPIANTFRRVEVNVKSDGTFERVEGGIPSTGTIAFSGDEATLHVERVLDRPVEDIGQGAVRQNKPIVLKWLGKDQIEYTDPGSFNPEPLVLHRKSATTD